MRMGRSLLPFAVLVRLEEKIKYLRGEFYLANEVGGGAFPAGYSCCPRCAAEPRGGPACWSLAAGRPVRPPCAAVGSSSARKERDAVAASGARGSCGGAELGRGGRDRSSSVRAGPGNEALFAGAQGQLTAAGELGSAVPPVALSSLRLQGGVSVSPTARARRLQACGFDQVLLKPFSAGLQNI